MASRHDTNQSPPRRGTAGEMPAWSTPAEGRRGGGLTRRVLLRAAVAAGAPSEMVNNYVNP
jgi:hypothetical protein